jgi:hypothetical protein
MQAAGGLKLNLAPPTRDDRCTRFAQVVLDGGSGEDTLLVTDSLGRLRYRLPAGQYRVRVLGGEETQFLVEDRRWTTVRLALR